VPDL
jgi:hypothetical protein